MSDSIFDIYQNAEYAKALWESLESKYMAEDASVTKFLVSNFINYKMVDTKPVMEQYHEMLRILGQYTQHNLMMDEAISVAVIIDKLSPSWKEFKHGLKHKMEELNLVQLGSHLRIEEGLRNQELDNNPKGKNQIGSSSVNMVEKDGAKNSNNNKNKRKFKSGDDKFANKKGTITCWKCKKTDHIKKYCRSRKGNDGAGSNASKDPEKQQGYNSDFMQNFVNVLHYVFVISDAFYVQDDEVAWWVNSGAIIHVCKDLRWFQVCKSIEDGSFVKMGNIATEPIKGIGHVLLTFTSGKTLCLDNVLYVPGIRKNLVSEIVLNKCGYKQVLESDKYILSRYGSFVGFGYNRVAERKNRTLKEMVNSMLFYFGLSEGFWGKGCRAVVRLTEPKMKNMGEKESRDAIFDEERFTSIPRPRGMIQPSSSKIAEDEVEGTDDVPGPSEDPRTLSEAMASRDVAFWKEAVQSELDSIMHNDTWKLTDLPPGCKELGCKWILKRKMKVDGSIDKYKARLVIQGFRQKEGIDFFDTYAPVARISTIRLLLALTAIHDLVIHQMDVKTVFLNGDLDEEIYMKQPEGFAMPGHESKVCKLKKSLYDLKQPPKQWHQKIDDVVLSSGCSLNQADKCVYSKFDASDLGEAGVILGIRIKRGNNDPTVKFRHNKGTSVSQLEYSRAIGCLMYAMISTRPDIAFAVGKLSRVKMRALLIQHGCEAALEVLPADIEAQTKAELNKKAHKCSSCGALYTTDYCCSVGILRDKIICDLDKTPDLSQRSPQNCPKCGNPVNGHYCQGCAFLRKKFKEDLFASCVENEILQDSSKPSNDNPNVVNAPREPFVVNQDPSKNSSLSPPQIYQQCCYGCGNPLEGIFCHQCT
nr:zinc finger, CCHC-type [Tanacetum cinerariifolium]